MKQNSLVNVGYITGQLLKPENDYNTKMDNKMNTYQMEKKNKNSFNWGFLTGVLFSFLVWIALIYIFK